MFQVPREVLRYSRWRFNSQKNIIMTSIDGDHDDDGHDLHGGGDGDIDDDEEDRIHTRYLMPNIVVIMERPLSRLPHPMITVRSHNDLLNHHRRGCCPWWLMMLLLLQLPLLPFTTTRKHKHSFLMWGNFICCSFFLMPLAVSIDGLMMSLLDGLLASGMVSFIAIHAYIFLIGQHSLA